MRFKVDENLHAEIAALLRERGHDALTVFDEGHRGRSDRDIANLTQLGEDIVGIRIEDGP